MAIDEHRFDHNNKNNMPCIRLQQEGRRIDQSSQKLRPRICRSALWWCLVSSSSSSISLARAARLPFGVVVRATGRQFQKVVLHEAFLLQHKGRGRRSSAILPRSSWEILRGGHADVNFDEETSEEDEEESEGEDEAVTAVIQEETQIFSKLVVDEAPRENKDVANDDGDENASSTTAAATTSQSPVPVLLQTSVGNALLDQSLELTLHPTRTIASIKTSASRQLPGRPPVESLRVVWQGQEVSDDVMVATLLKDLDDDDDEDNDDDTDDDESAARLTLMLDIIPPVDPKFVAMLETQMQDLTIAELLDAYATNEAAVFQNAALLLERTKNGINDDDDGDNNDDTDKDSNDVSFTRSEHQQPQEQRSRVVVVSLLIRQQARQIKQDWQSTLLSSPHDQALLANESRPSQPTTTLDWNQRMVRRGHRVRYSTNHQQQQQQGGGSSGSGGGVTLHYRRRLQRNLNVHWADTVRYMLLFLFFGYFGGRTPTSRALLLLGAPGVIVMQWRPMQRWLTQVMYVLLDQPVGLVSSLLPAPQQAILNLNVQEAMREIYGEHVLLEEEEEASSSIDDASIRQSGVEVSDSDDEEYEEDEDAMINRLVADVSTVGDDDDDYDFDYDDES